MELKSFFDFTKLPTKIFIVISIVTGFFIFATPPILKKFRLEKFDEYGGYIGLAFLFTTILVLLNFIMWIYSEISFNIRLTKLKAEIQQTINTLDNQEKAVLREFFIRNQSSIKMPIDDAVISGLLDKKVLKMNTQVNGSSFGSGMSFALSLDNYVNKILTLENINLINNPTEIEKQTIINNRPEWTNSGRY